MRRIVVSTYASLDGVVDAPPETTYLRFQDEEVSAHHLALLAPADTVLLGRRTYLGLASFWRDAAGPFAEFMKRARWVVVSTTLENADAWEGSMLISDDVERRVADLKEEPGGDIVSFGCGRLARTLCEAGLIDEFRIWVAPVVVGAGARLLDEPGEPIVLRPTGTRDFDSGAALHTYAPGAT
jgi:dihydrofolate reductase